MATLTDRVQQCALHWRRHTHLTGVEDLFVTQEEAAEEVPEVHSVAADDSQTQCALSGALLDGLHPFPW